MQAFLREFDEALVSFERAFELSPNDADVLAYYGETLNYADQPEKGLELIQLGVRLDPLGPPNWDFHLGHSYYKMGLHDEAVSYIRQSMMRGPEFPVPYLYLAVLYEELNRKDEAKTMVKIACEKAPNYSIATIAKVIPHKSAKQINRFLSGLSAAGMPEE
jgi:adenylate cyclase